MERMYPFQIYLLVTLLIINYYGRIANGNTFYLRIRLRRDTPDQNPAPGNFQYRQISIHGKNQTNIAIQSPVTLVVSNGKRCSATPNPPFTLYTVAHCLYNDDGLQFNISDVFIEEGKNKLIPLDGRIHVHEEYDVTTHMNDFALIYLNNPEILSNSTDELRLFGSTRLHADDCIVLTTRLPVPVKMLDQVKCTSILKSGNYNLPGALCAVNRSRNVDLKPGDSGSALLCAESSNHDFSSVVGVYVSQSNSTHRHFYVFSYLRYYAELISNVTNDLQLVTEELSKLHIAFTDFAEIFFGLGILVLGIVLICYVNFLAIWRRVVRIEYVD